jgi:hypothetical protein
MAIAAVAVVALVAAAWTLGHDRGPRAPAAPGEPVHAEWDLLQLVRAEPELPPRRTVGTVDAYGEARMAVATPIPGELSYPVAIPTRGYLDFGYALNASVFLTSVPAYSQPTRFRVLLKETGGPEYALFDRVLNIRDRPDDRRWMDAHVDLESWAGVKGTLSFTATLEEPPHDYESPALALFSAPRILVDARPQDVSILLVTVDCLRADHVGAYGYKRPTTPNLDALAAEGVRFAHAYANGPMTIPSLPQILSSSLFPGPAAPLVIGPVAAAGIPSAAIVNNVWLSLWLGSRPHTLPDAFDVLLGSDGAAHAGVLTDHATAWLDRHRGERFALYVHYLDAHSPYTLYPAKADVFGDPAYKGKVTRDFDDQTPDSAARYDAQDRARVVSLYDAGVHFADENIGRLIQHLREDGRLDRTIVVVSADHGEEFWDHGRFFHGQSLYDELLHVPLIMRLPNGERGGTVVDRPVRGIDIAPTLLDWARLPRPAAFAGRSLRAAMEHPEAPADDVVATAINPQFPMRYGLRTATHKLVETVRDGSRQLFDLVHDPAERESRFDADPDTAATLDSRLAAVRAALRTRGYQLRVVGSETPVHFSLKLEVPADAGLFVTLDRTEGATDATIDAATDGHTLTVEGVTDADGRGFRFDRQLGFTGTNVARMTLTVEGTPARPGIVGLGAVGQPLAGEQLDLDDATLESTDPPTCPPPERGLRVCLWRLPGTVTGALSGPDAAARERLRALGYVQ